MMTAPQPADSREASLLIVDDDDIDAMALERSFRKMKLLNPRYRARDGQEALDMLRQGTVPEPCIILLDLNMPRVSGLEFLKILRSDPAFSNVVVFVLTTSKSDEDRTAAYRDHVSGYILKHRGTEGFLEVVTLIDRYWRIVELPLPGGNQP